jgi:PPOX class probable F420-dependent enzyme
VSELERLSQGKYLSLTTFKRDGTAVATPVWVAREGDHLYVITQADSGKAKRLRHTPRVLLAPCDVRGTLTGPQVQGSARLLDPDGTAVVARLIDAKYGLLGKAMGWLDRAVRGRGQSRERVGIAIVPDEDPGHEAAAGDG